MSVQTVDAIIVGFGPVGGFLALQLAQQGLRVVILERSTESVVLPRAVGLDGESVRSFQRLGLGESVASILQPPRERDEVCFTDSKHNVLFGQDIPVHGAMGWRDMAFFDQPELEAFLREEVARVDLIDAHLGADVTSIGQSADRARAEVSLDGQTQVFEAPYLIGCDGASSFVRRASGIEWLSLGYDQDWLVVDITIGDDCALPVKTMQVCDPHRLITYVCVKDPNRRWEFQLIEGETREQMMQPETIRALLDEWLPEDQYRIRRAAVYQFHAATAGRWREGRVLLAGDAAHQTPPFLGQGLNSGFRDAVNLGWKIPMVVRSEARDTLLDSYEAERDGHARLLVERAVGIGKLMETLAAREAGLPDPHPPQDTGGGFGGSLIPPMRAGLLVEEQLAGVDTPVGQLLRQPTVKSPSGEPCRLDELIGPGFAVVARHEADLEFGAASRAVLERLGGRALSIESLTPVLGEHDRVFEKHAAVVLRPDRYIFGLVDDDWDLDRLLAHLADGLCLT